jgi:hypothetical protein
VNWRPGQARGEDLRDLVLAPSDAPFRAAAARFGVSASYVVKARARQRASGQTTGRSTIKIGTQAFKPRLCDTIDLGNHQGRLFPRLISAAQPVARQEGWPVGDGQMVGRTPDEAYWADGARKLAA